MGLPSLPQLIIAPIILIPFIHVLISDRTRGWVKFGWFLVIFFFSWLAYIVFLIVTRKKKVRSTQLAGWKLPDVGKAYTYELADMLGVRQAYVFDALKHVYGNEMFLIMANFKEEDSAPDVIVESTDGEKIPLDFIALREPLLDGFANLSRRHRGIPDFDRAFDRILLLDMAWNKIEDNKTEDTKEKAGQFWMDKWFYNKNTGVIERFIPKAVLDPMLDFTHIAFWLDTQFDENLSEWEEAKKKGKNLPYPAQCNGIINFTSDEMFNDDDIIVLAEHVDDASGHTYGSGSLIHGWDYRQMDDDSRCIGLTDNHELRKILTIFEDEQPVRLSIYQGKGKSLSEMSIKHTIDITNEKFKDSWKMMALN